MNTQLNLSDVYVFNSVARRLSFTAAAREIGFSRSAISKKISRLEQDLGVILLNRSTRCVNLTEAGRTFFKHTLEAAVNIEHGANVVRAADLEPSGTVKLSLPSSLSRALMPKLVTEFQQSWPDVKIILNVEDRLVDLIGGGYELAICITQKLADSNLISRRIGSTRQVLAASPGYLQQFGTPLGLDDLEHHRCLGFDNAEGNGRIWRFDRGDDVIEIPASFPVASNNTQTLIDAACLGSGIIYLPDACISDEITTKRLQTLLVDCYAPKSYGIFAIFPHRNSAAKVKVLVNFVEQILKSPATTD